MAREKPNFNVVFVGHVDHGKSTSIGRLWYESGKLPEQELAKLREEAVRHGKAGFEFAFVMDKFKEERERGLTIDLSYKKIVTQKFDVFWGLNAKGTITWVPCLVYTEPSQCERFSNYSLVMNLNPSL